MRKNFTLWAIQICQNQSFISSTLSGKSKITFINIWAIFARKQGEVISQKVTIEIWQILVHLHDFWSASGKKNLVPVFSSFTAIDYKEHFRKILTGIFKFGCFSWYHDYIF